MSAHETDDAILQSGGNPYVAWLRAVYNFIGPSGTTPDPRGVVTPADIEFEATNRFGVLGTIRNRVFPDRTPAEVQADEQQLANILALRPAAQETREPVPVEITPTPTPPGEVFGPPEPVQDAGDPQIDEFLRLFTMADFFGNIQSSLGEFNSILGNVGGLLGRGAPQAAGFLAGPVGRAVIGGAAGAGIFEGASSLLGFGGNGNGTALQRIKADAKRNVTRKKVVQMARVCGLEQTASTLNTSVTNVCEVVAQGMPRRSRGISSRDMARTRSTLGKLNTMQRSLGSLCTTPRRRAPSRARCK